MIYRLHKWSVSSSADRYLAPECRTNRLVGYRDDETEHRVVTSPIVKVDGKSITTYSGSVYLLEDIDPDYLEWMKSEGIRYDADNPIKVKS